MVFGKRCNDRILFPPQTTQMRLRHRRPHSARARPLRTTTLAEEAADGRSQTTTTVRGTVAKHTCPCSAAKYSCVLAKQVALLAAVIRSLSSSMSCKRHEQSSPPQIILAHRPALLVSKEQNGVRASLHSCRVLRSMSQVSHEVRRLLAQEMPRKPCPGSQKHPLIVRR